MTECKFDVRITISYLSGKLSYFIALFSDNGTFDTLYIDRLTVKNLIAGKKIKVNSSEKTNKIKFISFLK